MKRHSERDSPPRHKRSREYAADVDRYENNGERSQSSRYSKQDKYSRPTSSRRHSPVPPAINENRYYNDSVKDDKRKYEEQTDVYRSLCVRNIFNKVENSDIERFLYDQYSSFGEFNVKIGNFSNGEKVAYINFKYPDQAREARHAKPKLFFYDRPSAVEPVYGGKNRDRDRPPTHLQPATQLAPSAAPPLVLPLGHEFVDLGLAATLGTLSPPDPARLNRRGGAGSPPRMLSSRPSETSLDAAGKKDVKFPYHMIHVDPENDPKATRTLFIGNLPCDITAEEIRPMFEKYGVIEDIDIKRPTKGSGNAYAFVKYLNLDMAHRAKVDMSGRYIRNHQCKIGYGKASPTQCLWVGGLGPWIQYDTLESTFERYGPVARIEWPQGKNYAYVLYETVEVATTACTHMRGFALGGADKKIRVDYCEVEHMQNDPRRKSGPGGIAAAADRGDLASGPGNRVQRGILDDQSDHGVVGSRGQLDSEGGQRRGLADHDRQPAAPTCPDTVTTVAELCKCSRVVWTGRFRLKNVMFGCRVYVIKGEEGLIADFLTPSARELRISQRMKLESAKLDDVSQRIRTGGNDGICVMLAVPAPLDSTTLASLVAANNDDAAAVPALPQKPLRTLVAYLRTKDSAGVVHLKTDKSVGVLHAFAPCTFSHAVLSQTAILMSADCTSRDDHLLLVLIRSS